MCVTSEVQSLNPISTACESDQTEIKKSEHRVLIVTSSYAPTMIADMHRARQLAWELPKVGWEVEILSPDSSYQHVSCLDADSFEFFSPGTPVHFVPQYCSRIFRAVGLRGVGWRALLPMLFSGWSLLNTRRFDLVYISTAQFPLFLLGIIWRWLTSVPFILDFHDPCFMEGASHPIWTSPNFKHRVSHWLTRNIEFWSTSRASGLVSVSPDYVETLRWRYESSRPSWLVSGHHAVIPFAVLQHDLEEAARRMTKAENTKGRLRIVYVGAGGPIMHRAFSLICRSLSSLREQDGDWLNGVQFEFYGTMLGWKEGDSCDLANIANKEGVGDLVIEDPRRISYRRSLELLLGGDGALILGVDDGGYMPSKLFTYAQSGKPLLAVFRRDSPAYDRFMSDAEMGHTMWFDKTGEMPLSEAAGAMRAFLKEVAGKRIFNRGVLLAPFDAHTMAQRHALLFETCLLHIDTDSQ